MELESQPGGNDSFSSHLLNQVENISSPNQKSRLKVDERVHLVYKVQQASFKVGNLERSFQTA